MNVYAADMLYIYMNVRIFCLIDPAFLLRMKREGLTIIKMNAMCNGRYKIICITNRHLTEGFLTAQIRKILSLPSSGPAGMTVRPSSLILREKDMSPEDYAACAIEVKKLCEAAGVEFIAHTFIQQAIETGADAIHLPLSVFLAMDKAQKQKFRKIGVSAHSLEEARLAWQNGASYITASHIFPTQCKPGLPPRGLAFLRKICEKSPIPVYALGGIRPENISDCLKAGAAGVCMMSEYMK